MASYVHPRRTPPRHPLRLRPADRPGSADRAIAPGAALPQPRGLVFAESGARQPLHQLAAGPVRQLPGAAGVPRKDHRIQGHGGPGGGDVGLQPVRLLPGAARRELPLPLQRIPGAGTRSLSGHRSGHAAAAELSRQDRPHRAPHHRLPGRHQPAGGQRHPVPHPPGARRADARGNAGKSQRLLPRFRLAAGADAAPRGAGGALRVGLPDPAHP